MPSRSLAQERGEGAAIGAAAAPGESALGSAGAVVRTLMATGAPWKEVIETVRATFPGLSLGAVPELVEWAQAWLVRAASFVGSNLDNEEYAIPVLDFVGSGTAFQPFEAVLAMLLSTDASLGNAAFLPLKNLEVPNLKLSTKTSYGMPFELLSGLPEGLKVRGTLEIHYCAEISEIPPGVEVGSALVVNGLPRLETLPKDLRVGNRITVSRCDSFSRIPEFENPPSGLTITLCQGLTNLPNHIKTRDSQYEIALVLGKCNNLKSIPEGFKTHGHVYIAACDQLREFPDHWNVAGGLTFDRCKGLRELPEGLTVHGDLVLNHCPWVKTLPSAFAVQGALVVKHCARWDGVIQPFGPVILGPIHIESKGKAPIQVEGLKRWRMAYGEGSCFGDGAARSRREPDLEEGE